MKERKNEKELNRSINVSHSTNALQSSKMITIKRIDLKIAIHLLNERIKS